MALKCPVILNNDAVTVVKYKNIEIQFPAIGRDAKYVNVDFADGKYTIVENKKTENKIESFTAETPKENKEEKKTTVKEVIKPQNKKEFGKKV